MNDPKRKLKFLPNKPGVYVFRGEKNKILYVGKAKSLKKRVSSYFTKTHDSPKTRALVENIRDIEYIVTSSELEAIMLESNLIKKERPRYNIILRDDKQYPYLKITVGEEWPRLLLTRKIEKDGAKYFGPYSGSVVRETLRQIKRLFPLRWCRETPMKKRKQPCMYFHIKRCLGPCIGAVDNKTYDEMAKEVIGLLEGRLSKVIEGADREMRAASDAQEYEKARVLRDRIRSMEKIAKGQAVISTDVTDRDVLGLARRGNHACVLFFQIREGKLVGREIFYPHETSGFSDEDLIASSMKQYYADAAYIPASVLLGHEISERNVIEKFISGIRGAKFKVTKPRSGNKRKLVEMAERNAEELLSRRVLSDREKESAALIGLKNRLRLARPPIRIEAFDVSNIQGTDIVGSMVVFVAGHAYKRDYRRFILRTVAGQDDVAAIYEIVSRRYSKTLKGELELPDLVLIDGGKGQVNAARRALDESGFSDISVIGLAKRLEEVYIYGRKSALKLSATSPMLQLLQRIRDEAHRFAVTFHRLKRSKRMTT